MGEILDRAFGGGGLTLITAFNITSTLSILSENTDLYCSVHCSDSRSNAGNL